MTEITDKWSESDIQNLVEQVKKLIPAKDGWLYKRRLEKFPWEKLALDGHTAEECKELIVYSLKSMRKFRLLSEMMDDMALHLHQAKIKQEMPKKPLSSYFLYIKQNFHQKKADMNNKEFVQFISKQFQSLPPEVKQRYTDLSKIATEDYNRKLKTYSLRNPEEKSKIKRATPLLSAFDVYLRHKISNSKKTLSDEDLLKFDGKWDNLSEDEKIKWFRQASVLNDEIKEEIAKNKKPKAPSKKQTKTISESSKIEEIDVKAVEQILPEIIKEEINHIETEPVKKKKKKRKHEEITEAEPEPEPTDEKVEKKKKKKKDKDLEVEDVPVECNEEEEPRKKKKKKKDKEQDHIEENHVEIEEVVVKKKKKKKDKEPEPIEEVIETPSKKKKKKSHKDE